MDRRAGHRCLSRFLVRAVSRRARGDVPRAHAPASALAVHPVKGALVDDSGRFAGMGVAFQRMSAKVAGRGGLLVAGQNAAARRYGSQAFGLAFEHVVSVLVERGIALDAEARESFAA